MKEFNAIEDMFLAKENTLSNKNFKSLLIPNEKNDIIFTCHAVIDYNTFIFGVQVSEQFRGNHYSEKFLSVFINKKLYNEKKNLYLFYEKEKRHLERIYKNVGFQPINEYVINNK